MKNFSVIGNKRAATRVDLSTASFTEPWQRSRRNPEHLGAVMNRLLVSVISVAVASMFASEALFAAPSAVYSPVPAMFAKVKTVKFNLRNDSTTPLVLKVAGETVTLDAGVTKAMDLPLGTRIVRQDASAPDGAGALVTQVVKELSGVTIALKG